MKLCTKFKLYLDNINTVVAEDGKLSWFIWNYLKLWWLQYEILSSH